MSCDTVCNDAKTEMATYQVTVLNNCEIMCSSALSEVAETPFGYWESSLVIPWLSCN